MIHSCAGMGFLALLHNPSIRKIKKHGSGEERTIAERRRVFPFALCQVRLAAGYGVEAALFAVGRSIVPEDGNDDVLSVELPDRGSGVLHRKSGEGDNAYYSLSGTWRYLRNPTIDIPPNASPPACRKTVTPSRNRIEPNQLNFFCKEAYPFPPV
jgi:hypothetical protein